MSSTRLIVILLLAAAGAIGSHRPACRARISVALDEARLWIFGPDADDLYYLAERHYQAGDFEKAELTCDRALKLAPRHAQAAALLAEVRFVMGKGTPSWDPLADYSPYIARAPYCHRQTLIEIDRCLASAEQLLEGGERAKAEAEFRKVLEYAKWMPASAELERRCDRARAGLAEPTAR